MIVKMRFSYDLLLLACLLVFALLLPPVHTQAPALNPSPAIHVNKYSTAMINITWMDPKKKVLKTNSSETGRFSTDGSATVSGVLALANSKDTSSAERHFGCSPDLELNRQQDLEVPVIALLSRGGCVFDQKVENAEAAGAVAVIIFNNKKENKLGTIAVTSPAIPVVFTYMWKGRELMQLVERGIDVFITLEEGSLCEKDGGNSSSVFSCIKTKDSPGQGQEEMMNSWAVITISVSFLALMFLSLGLILIYYYTRLQRLQAKDAVDRRACKQALKALNNVKLMVVNQKEEEKECMVCLDMMKKGEDVRHLPCDHKFHQHCIDTWLLNRRKCPLCKLNIVQHFGLVEYQDSESDMPDILHVS